MDSSENNFNQIPSIKTLQAFEQTARFGNVAKAAEHLNLTPSAVSHQIAKLEEMIGQSLFIRGARGVTLTLLANAIFKMSPPFCITSC